MNTTTQPAAQSPQAIPLELNPVVMYASVDEKLYKSELELFDRWQSFSAELLRLSLLGIAIFGFLFKEVFIDSGIGQYRIGSIKLLSQLSLAFFAASTVSALIYRYGSTEAMMHFFRGLKYSGEERSQLQTRNRWLTRCLVFKIISALCLGLGAVCSAIAFFMLL